MNVYQLHRGGDIGPSNIHSSRYQIFLQHLRQARKDAGLTQVEVSKLLGKPQSYVSKCESGERRVDFVELLDFAHIYDKNLDYFLP